MTALYVPGVEETDPKKIIRSQQLVAGQTATNTTNIATNTTDLATANANIAANTAAIAALPTSASQAVQQAGTSNTNFVSPLHQQDHDSACKAWVSFTGRGTAGAATIDASYNVTSVTKTASPGVYTITFTTAFATANYCVGVSSENTSVVAPLCGVLSSVAKTTTTVTVFFENAGATTGQDPVHGYVQCFGRQ